MVFTNEELGKVLLGCFPLNVKGLLYFQVKGAGFAVTCVLWPCSYGALTVTLGIASCWVAPTRMCHQAIA